MPCHSKNHWYFGVAALLIPLVISFAQDDSPPSSNGSPAQSETGDSLASVVRRSKAQKTVHSKNIVADDDVQASLGPLPHLKMNEAENGEDVAAAIAKYRQAHSPAETEDMVRRWYQEYDEELETAITENSDIKTLREANVSNSKGLCQSSNDYRECQERQMAEMNGAQHDEEQIKRNNDRIVRIQHSLLNIRNRLFQMGLHYDWFKVRTTNNIDRF
jgi:hypothetical protein